MLKLYVIERSTWASILVEAGVASNVVHPSGYYSSVSEVMRESLHLMMTISQDDKSCQKSLLGHVREDLINRLHYLYRTNTH